MNIFGGIMSIAGLGLDIFGKLQAGEDAEDAARRNAALYGKEAELIEFSTAETLRKHGIEVSKLKGMQTVGYAHAGVTTEGTPTDVMAETAYQGAIDAAIISRDGAIRAEIARMGGAQALGRGEDISRASKISAASSLLTQLGKWNT